MYFGNLDIMSNAKARGFNPSLFEDAFNSKASSRGQELTPESLSALSATTIVVAEVSLAILGYVPKVASFTTRDGREVTFIPYEELRLIRDKLRAYWK